MKNIVLLSDGTGNSAAKLFKTNVWRLYQALDLTSTDPKKTRQIAYYDDGVGTSSLKPLAVIGGAFGWGLKRNVLDLYCYLSRNYEPGDSVSCFGFSRGAFTIRVLIGLINREGLPSPELTETQRREQAENAFGRYRSLRKHWKRKMSWNAGVKAAPHETAPRIDFVGLWDTVAAYGLPIDELTRAWSFLFPLSVPDRDPCDIMQRACHVLALDDERKTFHPILWNEKALPQDATHIADERITQVWFAGAHSDVGGGYAEDALSHVSLAWMIEQARHLHFDADAVKRLKAVINVNGMQHDPRKGAGAVYRYLPRDVAALCKDTHDKRDQVVIARPKIHESVFDRIDKSDDNYAPLVIPANYAVVDASGAIHALASRETQQAAERRVREQARIWDRVHLRRLLYFVSVAVALVLAAFPLLFPAGDGCARHWSCFLSDALHLVNAVLPGFASPWINAYAAHPITFLLFAMALATLLWLSGRVRARMADRMRAIWKPAKSAPPVAKLRQKLGDAGSRLVASFYPSLARAWIATIVPVTTFAVLWLAFAALSQVGFEVMNSAGAYCAGTPKLGTAQWPHVFELDAGDICTPSGVRVRKGVEYELAFVLKQAGGWRDGERVVGVRGYAGEFATNVVAVPFRRNLTEDWFALVARVGDAGTGEYALRPAEVYTEPRSQSRLLVARFTARSSGELFLFANDVVVWPAVNWAYRNNSGKLEVTVRPVEAWPTPVPPRAPEGPLSQ